MTQISDKTARSVTLKEFSDWIKEHLHMTWFLGEGGAFSTQGREKDGGPYIKYFYPSLDTRTMKIFHIKTNYHEVDFREEFDGTILDLLLHKINEWRKPDEESTTSSGTDLRRED
jgi:hypothetical protein